MLIIAQHERKETTILSASFLRRCLSYLAFIIYLASQFTLRFGILSQIGSVANIQIRSLIEFSDAFVIALGIIIVTLNGFTFRVKGVLSTIVVTTLMIISAEFSAENTILLNLIVIYVCSANSYENLFKCYFFTAVTCVLINVFIESVFIFNKDACPNGRVVFSYGFTHPNRFSVILVSIAVALIVITRRYRNNLSVLVITVCISLFCKIVLSSNTGFIIALMLSIVTFVSNVKVINTTLNTVCRRQIYIVFSFFVPFICLISMLYLTANYDVDSHIHRLLNEILHGRVGFANSYYMNHDGFSILGKPYIVTSSYANGLPFQTVDCAYSYASIVYGLIPMLVSIVIYCKTVIIHLDRNYSYIIPLLISIESIYSLMENYTLCLAANSTLVFMIVVFRNSIYGFNKEIQE